LKCLNFASLFALAGVSTPLGILSFERIRQVFLATVTFTYDFSLLANSIGNRIITLAGNSSPLQSNFALDCNLVHLYDEFYNGQSASRCGFGGSRV